MGSPAHRVGPIQIDVPKRASTRPCHGAQTFPARRYQRMPANETVARLIDADTLPRGAEFARLLRAMSTEDLSECYFILQGPKAERIHAEISARLEKEKEESKQ